MDGDRVGVCDLHDSPFKDAGFGMRGLADRMEAGKRKGSGGGKQHVLTRSGTWSLTISVLISPAWRDSTGKKEQRGKNHKEKARKTMETTSAN